MKIHAGKVPPSMKAWYVLEAHDHPTLKFADPVTMVETPTSQNLLLRTTDYTLHATHDSDGQYVYLTDDALPMPPTIPVVRNTPLDTDVPF